MWHCHWSSVVTISGWQVVSTILLFKKACHLQNSVTVSSNANSPGCVLCDPPFSVSSQVPYTHRSQPLTHSLQSKPGRHSPCQVCHLDFIWQFICNIRHVAGQGNPVANALVPWDQWHAARVSSTHHRFSCNGQSSARCNRSTTLASCWQCYQVH